MMIQAILFGVAWTQRFTSRQYQFNNRARIAKWQSASLTISRVPIEMGPLELFNILVSDTQLMC